MNFKKQRDSFTGLSVQELLSPSRMKRMVILMFYLFFGVVLQYKKFAAGEPLDARRPFFRRRVPSSMVECGQVSPEAEPLIMNGRPASLGQFPWVAAMYLHMDGEYKYACSGTLIADNAVITAAHCTWNQKKENMSIVLGHISRNFPEKSQYPRNIFKIKRVYILPVYRDVTNYYNSDIAILALDKPAQLSDDILPACLPDLFGNISITPSTEAVVAGWGMNERREPPETLRYMKVPIVDSVRCMKDVPKPFIKFMTYTSFCAGYTNGTGACNGDSGTGLLTEMNGRWMLQGVVSVSPRKGTSKFCHPKTYTLFTKVMLYLNWIREVLEFEDKETAQEN